MISGITGTLHTRGIDWVEIDLGGITLQVSIPSTLAQELGDIGARVHLFTQLLLKDTEPMLYGFPTAEARRFFQMLTTVSGIGPRTALNLLSAKDPQSLASAIVTGDLESFTGIPGIGKKGAARIILELREKIENSEFFIEDTRSLPDGNAISALTALGYTTIEARQAILSLGNVASLELEEVIRRALVHIGTLSK
ncbi:Holliday junction branch migration protein RuvA [SAR202 cluster bacterium AD-804-J14_MRT_500m]|nr:Holliday junction branch migration protein RuvA [SAR202 cluster bacterium AD-804-J14_MRT_500m]